jgi:thymidine phosphorylase
MSAPGEVVLPAEPGHLQAKPFGIDTRYESVVYLRTDAAVARSEGFEAMSRVSVTAGPKVIVATLLTVSADLLPAGQVGLSAAAMTALAIVPGTPVTLSHAPLTASMRFVRAKVYGHRLDAAAFTSIIGDIVSGSFTNVHLAAFITACADARLNDDEIVHLTRAMVDVGERLQWPGERVVDKHCVGGLPGNRTTPIVVAIVAAHGLTMPKTSSRAITSPAGTADTMEVLAPVDLDLDTLRRVVAKEGACIAWGGSVSLSPADDILIRVERALDIDSEGQLVASVLSKKIAAGATDIVIDIPVGPTAKVRSREAAGVLSAQLEHVARAFGINVRIVLTDGSQPVGYGIGPAL